MINIINSIKSYLISNSLRVFVLSVILLGTCLVGNVYAANPAFNILGSDLETLRLENRTTNPSSVNPANVNWRDPISASAGDAISFDVYYHNGVDGSTANNTRIRINYPTTASTTITTTGYILSDNAPQISDTGTINVSTAQTITFESNAYWYPNQATTNPTILPVTNSGTYVEVNIGNIIGNGWSTQGSLVFRANVSSSGAISAPIVSAGSNRDINESQTIVLNGSATDPQSLAMTYSWTCSGGSLSSSTILTPTYTGPSVASDTTHTCTLTATNTGGISASSSVNILVRNTGSSGLGSPVVSAGSDRDLGENQTITLSGSATDPQGDPMTIAWNCSGGGLNNSTTLTPTYTAPSVDIDTTYFCTLTATDNTGNFGSDTAIMTVRNSGSGSGSGGSSGGGSGSPMINVSLSATPSSGPVPLTGVDLSAVVYMEGISSRIIVYSFDCDDDNIWEIRVESMNRNYTVQDLCNYRINGTYIARVNVEAAGYQANNQTTIIVGSGSSSHGIDVDAGINKNIFENQSVILNGSAYSYYGSNLTYYWTCNGGSLSNSTTLSPIYYAPAVDSDTTYACTLYVTDGRGYKNSDTTSITVRNATSQGINLRVTTNNPESVTGSTVVLNGIVNNDGGQYTSVRFNWGRLSTYSNFTSWINNKTSGQAFASYVSGLEKGKAYHYRVEASNGREIVVGQDVAFVTKPDQPTGFVALSDGTSQINLNWNTGTASCYTMITRKAGSYPANSGDGIIVYYGTGNSFADKSLVPGTGYYYRAWSVGCDEGLYSFSESQYARAYTLGGLVSVPNIIETVESNASVEVLARDFTQKEIAWQNSIISSPDDEIEFKVIITPTGGRSLENVILKNVISEKIDSISNIKINEESYSESINEVKLGTIALGESKIVTFKGKIGSKENFSYGSNDLENTIEVSAKGIETVKKSLTISVSRGMDSSAGLIQFMDLRLYSGVMTILFIILCLTIMYLLIERKRGKECIVEKEADTKVNKSKYFNIK
ncbi:MAG: PKD domain-containing protein [Candidatus Pacebacteria bacterium]|nr:PKD domain-containing protein [Candidatus Paceibacterota bacterium]